MAATIVNMGQALIQDLACSVNCVGRVKKPSLGGQRPVPPPPTLENAEGQSTLDQEPECEIPRASSSRFALAEEFVKFAWDSLLQDDQSTTSEAASNDGCSDDGSTYQAAEDFQEEEEVAPVRERWLLHWQALVESAMERDGLAVEKANKSPTEDLAEMQSTQSGAQEAQVGAETPAKEEAVQELLTQPVMEMPKAALLRTTNLEDDHTTPSTLDEDFAEEKEDFADDASSGYSTAEEDFTEEKEDFWGPADVQGARGLENAAPVSSLLRFRVIRHGDLSGASVLPWQRDVSRELYREMGMRDPKSSYIATWLNCREVSLLMVSKVVDEEWLQKLVLEDALTKNLKLILRPIRARIPFPAKAAPQADTIGSYFGTQSSSLTQHTSSTGIRHLCVQVDLYSKWQLRLAMQKVGFREGNILDMLVVDWPGNAVVSSCQLIVTQELLQLMA